MPSLATKGSVVIKILLTCLSIFLSVPETSLSQEVKSAVGRGQGVCPPFPLRDEAGNIIHPGKGILADVPYSPKKTCGAPGCHDYAKITEGFHFTQGKGETLPPEFADRYNWVLFPGNYGGNWCSPAPLYRQLAPKKNTSVRTIDMTSFDFVTATCGNCHPGGGPMEYDRDGKRYDEWMKDPASALSPGADNGLDGDYYKARWSETGVIEADCLLCHLPEYRYKKRNDQLADLNFRWAATEGAGFGSIAGKVAAGEVPKVTYDLSHFDENGNVLLHLAPEPRNEACLGCHAKPDWKKKGASYSSRTDVHMAAGLRCVDCHAGGSRAVDARIKEREAHQFGKGDDPSGWVRNDLDNTLRTCRNCHLEGWGNAPLADHSWLPPLHLEKLACQACHIPNRSVKSALIQASDVYNPAPRISPPAKHIWTFYDQQRQFWNHYGELELFTAGDKPTNISRPTLVRYHDMIYPVNRVHSAWVGLEETGKSGLNQLFMKDFFQMWTRHRQNPQANFPDLARIADDDGDGFVEVNRLEEIDALLQACGRFLQQTGFSMQGKRLVWVSDSRAYYSSKEFRELPREGHEATAYASVYKLSHDVAPARAALGSGGCTDCHGRQAGFFQGNVLQTAFHENDGKARWIRNAEVLDISSFWLWMGILRESWIKPILYVLLLVLLLLGILSVFKHLLSNRPFLSDTKVRAIVGLFLLLGLLAGILVWQTPDLASYMLLSRFRLDSNHFWISLALLCLTATLLLRSQGSSRRTNRVVRFGWGFFWITLLAGGGMLLKFSWLDLLIRFSYTAFDLGLLALSLVSAILMVGELFRSQAPVAKPEEC